MEGKDERDEAFVTEETGAVQRRGAVVVDTVDVEPLFRQVHQAVYLIQLGRNVNQRVPIHPRPHLYVSVV